LACKLKPAKPWLRLWPGLRSFERESHGPRPSGQANARISLTSVDSEGFQCRLAALSPRQNIALPRNASDIHHPCTSTRFRNAVAVRVGLPSVGLRRSPHHLLPPHTTLVFANWRRIHGEKSPFSSILRQSPMTTSGTSVLRT
jgi:hypothetical protein